MEIEREVKKMTLGHDFGAGAACLKCKEKCEGFELHFWRKICRNCKCGLADHNVHMESEESKKVGKLFEDTKYTGLIAKLKTDGVPTYKGNTVTISLPSLSSSSLVPPAFGATAVRPASASASSSSAAASGPFSGATGAGAAAATAPGRALSGPPPASAAPARVNVTPVKGNAVPVTVSTSSAAVEPLRKDVAMKCVTYEWAPPGATKFMAMRYIELLPPEKRPVAGSEGAAYRRQQMACQLPEHDQDPSMCHELSPAEVKQMEQYVRKYKDEALGMGDVRLPEEMALVPSTGGQGGQGGQGGAGGPGGVGAAASGAGAGPAHAGPGDPSAGAGAGAGYGPGVRGVPAGAVAAYGPGAGGNGVPRPGSGSVVGFGRGDPGSGQGEPGSGQGAMATAAAAGAMGVPGGEVAGPERSFSCSHCQQPMRRGEPAVYAERAGYDRLWHPACFVCCNCSELLVDMIYFWKKGKLYCGRHYGDSEKPRCGGCDELIFSNEYTQAEGQNWHLKHFCCFDCDCVLAGETYVMEKDKPVCRPCYMNNYTVRCVACQQPVEPEAQRVSYGDHHWHAEPKCFQCSGCSKCLMGERFMAVQDKLFCSVECKKKTAA